MSADLRNTAGWALVEHALDGVMLTAPDGRIFSANPAACAMLRRSEEEIVALGRAGLVVRGPELDRALAERERTGSVASELPMLRGDGEVILVDVASRVFEGADGERLTAMTLRDVTERRRLERQLVESEQRFRALFDSGADAVVVHREGVIVDANARFHERFGYPLEALGTLPVVETIAPASRQAADAFIADGGAGPTELELVRADGSTVWCEVRAADVTLGGAAARVVSVRDVEGRRRADAERAEHAARTAELERARSLAVLAGGIAHEFNNTLHVALAGVELAVDPAVGSADAARHLAAARDALGRAVDLSRAMLRYSGRETVVRDWVDLAALVSAAAARVEGAVPRVQIDERPRVRVDGDAIAGVVIVLLENAADATGDTGEVAVRIGTVELTADEAAAARPVGEVAPGSYAVVEVRDDGEGMDEATSSHMFDPFFSTRFAGRGLGLAAALGVARAHRGGFVVRSESGQGTAVRLLVPLGDVDG